MEWPDLNEEIFNGQNVNLDVCILTTNKIRACTKQNYFLAIK